MRLVYAEDVKERIDKFFEDLGMVIIGKNLGYYPGLMDLIDDAPTVNNNATPIPDSMYGIDIMEAVEKQIPKNVLYSGAAACPNCRKILLYGKFEVPGNYCKWCGQHLEVNEYED